MLRVPPKLMAALPGAARPRPAQLSSGQTDTTHPAAPRRLPAPRARPPRSQWRGGARLSRARRGDDASRESRGEPRLRERSGAWSRERSGHGAATGAAAAAVQPAARAAALGVAAHPRRRPGHRHRSHPRPARPGPAPASPARRFPRRAQGRRPRAGVAVAARAGPRRPPRINAVIAASGGGSCGRRRGGDGNRRRFPAQRAQSALEPAGEGTRALLTAGPRQALRTPAVPGLWMASCRLYGAFHIAWPGATPRESMDTGSCFSSASWISISRTVYTFYGSQEQADSFYNHPQCCEGCHFKCSIRNLK